MAVRPNAVVVGVLVVVGAAASIGGVYLTAASGEFHPLLLIGVGATSVWIAIDDETSGDTCGESCRCEASDDQASSGEPR